MGLRIYDLGGPLEARKGLGFRVRFVFPIAEGQRGSRSL